MDQQTPPDVSAQLAQMLAQLQASGVQPQAAASGWAKPQVTTAPTGLAVPLSIETPNGKIRVYLDYPAEAAASPQSIMSLLESLAAQGFPLDIWRGGAGAWGKGNSGGGWRR
jgi:hypothetical protein